MSGQEGSPGLTDDDLEQLAQWAVDGPNLKARPGERVTLECEECGDTFEVSPSRSDRRFCSRECASDAGAVGRRSEKVSLECERCGDSFEVIPSRSDSARFCSRECWADAGGAWA